MRKTTNKLRFSIMYYITDFSVFLPLFFRSFQMSIIPYNAIVNLRSAVSFIS